MWKKWRGSQQVPILHGISREHHAMHATQLFIDRSGVPHAHIEWAQAWGTLDRKSTLFKLIVKFFLKGVVFMFLHDIVYIELLYCVTNFELVWTWNSKLVWTWKQWLKRQKSVDCTHFPLTTFVWYPKIVAEKVGYFKQVKTFWRPLIWQPPQTPGLDPPLSCTITILLLLARYNSTAFAKIRGTSFWSFTE